MYCAAAAPPKPTVKPTVSAPARMSTVVAMTRRRFEKTRLKEWEVASLPSTR